MIRTTPKSTRTYTLLTNTSASDLHHPGTRENQWPSRDAAEGHAPTGQPPQPGEAARIVEASQIAAGTDQQDVRSDGLPRLAVTGDDGAAGRPRFDALNCVVPQLVEPPAGQEVRGSERLDCRGIGNQRTALHQQDRKSDV